MEFFHKIKFLTEDTINYDVTFGVILSTAHLYDGQKLDAIGFRIEKSRYYTKIPLHYTQSMVR